MSIQVDKFNGDSCCCSVKINLLAWSECKTLDKKIGFIVGRSINYTFSVCRTLANGGVKLIKNTNDLLRLTKIAGYIFRPIKWTVNYAGTQLSNGCHFVFNKIDSVCHKIFGNCVGKKKKSVDSVSIENKLRVLKKIWSWTVTPLYKGLSSVCSTIKSLILTVFKFSSKQVKAVYNFISPWTVTPLVNHVLTPVLKKIGEIGKSCLRHVGTVLKKGCNWTIVPFFKRIVSPALDWTYNLVWGIISGVSGKKEDSKTVIEKEFGQIPPDLND